MRKPVFFIGLLLIFSTILAPITIIAQESSEENTFWYDDFEDYEINTFPKSWSGSGNAGASGNYITDLESYSGDKSLRLEGRFGGCWASLAHRYINLSNEIGKSLTMEVSVRFGKHTTSCHTVSASFGLYVGSDWTTDARGFFLFGKDLKTMHAADNERTELGTFEIDKWYRLRIKYSWISNSSIEISYWIDGEYRGKIIDNVNSYENKLIYITIISHSGVTYFDDISVSVGYEFPIEIVVIVVSAAAGSTVLLFVVLTDLGKYKFLSLLSFIGPLYFRTVDRDEVLENNEKRQCMYNYIAENQPVVYSDIKRICGLSDGEINWHAHMMTHLEIIKMKRTGFHLFFYVNGPKLPQEEFIRLTDIQKSIVDLVSQNEGITQVELSKELGIAQQNISYNLKKLENNGKIRIEKVVRIKHYYPVKKDANSI